MDYTHHIGALIITVLIGALTVPVALFIAYRYKIVDAPDSNRKLHQKVTPYLGGVVIFLGFTAGFLYLNNGIPSLFDTVSYLGVSGLFVLGLVDDIRGVPAKLKLILQLLLIQFIASASLCHWQCDLNVQFIMHWLVLTLTGVLIINAINLIDGLDGLSSLITVSILVVIGALALYDAQDTAAQYSSVLAASIVPFYLMNRHPAKMFMGDTGSLFIGGMIFWLFSTTHGHSYNPVEVTAAWVPMITSVPVIDVFAVIWIRLKSGVNIMQADRNHLHHRISQFFSHTFTVRLIALLSLTWSIVTIVLIKTNGVMAVLMGAGVMFGSVYGLLHMFQFMRRKNIENRTNGTKNVPQYIGRALLKNSMQYIAFNYGIHNNQYQKKGKL